MRNKGIGKYEYIYIWFQSEENISYEMLLIVMIGSAKLKI